MKHCRSCTCDNTPEVESNERIRLKKLFGRVPDAGCLDYRAGRYCGKPCVTGARQDRCKEHNHG